MSASRLATSCASPPPEEGARPPWGGPAAASAAVDYQSLRFEYRRHPDQDASAPPRHPVVVVGAGPVGLALAIDLAQRAVPVVLLDNDCTLSTGSRAICFAKRTLEIFDRLGCGERMVAKGVSWQVGKVFFGDREIYRFDLLPEPGHRRPAFINLQQYYVEGFLAERAATLGRIDLRWSNEVLGLEMTQGEALLRIGTPEGEYRLAARHVVACDGSRSPLRRMLGQETTGRVFRDRFLIADVTMDADLPTERRFWFDPPFHPGQSVLLHKQADGMWRVDFQLGWDADPVEERKPENIRPRIRALLDSIGHAGVHFEIGWASVYTFACQRMGSFRQGRVLFAGDAAHGVSPFGARGANSGVQDADNLGWKLAAVVRGEAPEALLDSYAREREEAADENIRHSTRATDFITPKSAASRLLRDAVLVLSRRHAFARRLVNSGRLSVATTLHGSPLNTPDVDAFEGAMVPGAAAADAPIELPGGRRGWLLDALAGPGEGIEAGVAGGFTALVFGRGDAADASCRAIAQAELPLRVLRVEQALDGSAPDSARALAAARYDASAGTVYLLRPDQHVCARWRRPTPQALRAAHARALARESASWTH